MANKILYAESDSARSQVELHDFRMYCIDRPRAEFQCSVVDQHGDQHIVVEWPSDLGYPHLTSNQGARNRFGLPTIKYMTNPTSMTTKHAGSEQCEQVNNFL